MGDELLTRSSRGGESASEHPSHHRPSLHRPSHHRPTLLPPLPPPPRIRLPQIFGLLLCHFERNCHILHALASAQSALGTRWQALQTARTLHLHEPHYFRGALTRGSAPILLASLLQSGPRAHPADDPRCDPRGRRSTARKRRFRASPTTRPFRRVAGATAVTVTTVTT